MSRELTVDKLKKDVGSVTKKTKMLHNPQDEKCNPNLLNGLKASTQGAIVKFSIPHL
jgi:hypothetical protein